MGKEVGGMGQDGVDVILLACASRLKDIRSIHTWQSIENAIKFRDICALL